MKLRSRMNRRSARIEIVPLIDIMFFLLATFVMVSTAMIKNHGIPVQLPSADSGAKQPREDSVSLTVNESGVFFLDRREVALSELGAALQSLKTSNAKVQVFINGDKGASVGSLVTALDEVRKAGITKVALETSAKGSE